MFLPLIIWTVFGHELLIGSLLLAAAIIDARSRCLPNGLAAAMAFAGVYAAMVPPALRGDMVKGEERVYLDAVSGLVEHAVPAIATVLALVLFELAWRARRGSAGIGMGDIKLLFALMLAAPLRGLLSFAAGLVLLALACLVRRERSLPLIPFTAVAWFALVVCGL